jgi:DNA-directed RNA polymerase subunit H (RpoH/RPB5)
MFRVCRNLVDILRRRGLIPSHDCLVCQALTSNDTFVAAFSDMPVRSRMKMIFTSITDPSVRYVILFATESNIGKQGVVAYIDVFTQENATAGMLVIENTNIGSVSGGCSASKRPITSMAVSVLQALSIPIEVFEDTQLVFNILEHELQPDFRVVDKSEHAELFATFCTREQLPRMRRDDPVARLLGVRRGDIVKAVQIVETSGTAILYLHVV